MAPFFTPSMITAEIGLINANLKRMLSIVTSSDKLPEDFVTGFVAFCQQWDDYRNALSVMSRTLNTTWDNIQSFKIQMWEWSETARKLGVNTYIAPGINPKKSAPSIKLPWWLWGIGGIMALRYLQPLRTMHSLRSLRPRKTKAVIKNKSNPYKGL